MDFKKLNEELRKLVESEERTFADWFGKDLTGQTYEGSIDCSRRYLTSLKGAPKIVTGNFNCWLNDLTSLKYAPQEVGGNFDCVRNDAITSLEGGPQKVGGSFDCSNNRLTTLKGAPKQVNGDFGCSYNNLKSLDGAPDYIGRNLYCQRNKELQSLEGAGQVKGKIKSDLEDTSEYLDSIEVATMEITWIPWDAEDGNDYDTCRFFKDENGTFSFSSDLETGSGYKTLSQAVKEAKTYFSNFTSGMYKKVKFSKIDKL